MQPQWPLQANLTGIADVARPRRTGAWARVAEGLRRMWFGADPSSGPELGASSQPQPGPQELRAVERALLRWVQLQRSESVTVPARRIESD